MKNSDIALVILIAAISFGLSYWIVGAIMKNPSSKVEEIPYIQEISESIEEPDHETFNAYAYNMNEDTLGGKCHGGTHDNGYGVCIKDGTEEKNGDNANSDDNSNSDEDQNPSNNPTSGEE